MKNRHTEGEPKNCPVCLAHAFDNRARAGQPAVDVIWQNGRDYRRLHYGMNRAKEKPMATHR